MRLQDAIWVNLIATRCRTVFASLRVATLLQEIYVGPLSREGEPTVLRKVKEVFTATVVRVRAFLDGVQNSVLNGHTRIRSKVEVPGRVIGLPPVGGRHDEAASFIVQVSEWPGPRSSRLAPDRG